MLIKKFGEKKGTLTQNAFEISSSPDPHTASKNESNSNLMIFHLLYECCLTSNLH